MSRRRPWKAIVCTTCHEDVLRLYRQDDRLKYAYAGRALYAHPDVEPGTVTHDKVWVAFDVEDDLRDGPLDLELVCRCHGRAGTHASVELGRAVDAARSTERTSVPLTEVSSDR